MRKRKLNVMTLEQLTARFAEAALIQYEASLDNNTLKYNRAFDRLVEIDEELRKRGSDARMALISLYKHSNIQVRLEAASFTAGIAPKRARKLLQEIKDEQAFPESADAGLALRRLDSGEWKPT